MKKTISIAMATYNGAKYLREQLESIYNQDMLPDEVVVSDDGSKDETLSILEEYHQKYGLKYSVNAGKHGVNFNFFRAISLCSKDVIAISDQDDIWLPNKISVSYYKLAEIDNGKPGCVSSLCNHIDKEGNLIQSQKDDVDTSGYSSTLLTYGKGQDRSQGCSLMFNRKLANLVLDKVKMYPEIETTMYYDGFIAFTAAITGVKYNLGKRLMLYRHHGTNVLASEKQKTPSIAWRIRKNDFFMFIPQSRIAKFSKLLEWFDKKEMHQEAYSLCQKIAYIDKGSHFLGLMKILSIKELTMFRRIEIFCGTLVMDFIKIFVH
ncbi:glycosyltransferase [Fibrobacter sp. UWP2]|uniref:glycosyltransferase n=1 Tax=Fibrobacter sp. UWP2 TaxID=1896216 RepID=UPI0009227B56|nr:glycosyltransferase [Fibrobacter sp. UWP2]SHJ34283.1 Glycosyl transferase family 2 [Fibrobacter sp. UWP2]